MRKIYIVEGRTGEWSDRHEWPVMAFVDEEEAKQLVLDATRVAKEIEKLKEEVGRYDAEVENMKNPFDPNMDMDYNGTVYYIVTVMLNEGVFMNAARDIKAEA